MSFTKAPMSAVITDAVGNTINLGNASGTFTAAPQSIVLTDANGNTLNVGSGVVAKFDATAQQANIASTPLYVVPAGNGGTYRVSVYCEITQAATTSSTLPQVALSWTGLDSGATNSNNQLTLSPTANTLGTYGAHAAGAPLGGIISVKGATTISVATFSYASSGATPMQYSVHVKLEYLGA